MLDKEKIIGRIDLLTQGINHTQSDNVPKLPSGMLAEQLFGLLQDHSALFKPLYRKSLREILKNRSVHSLTDSECDEALRKVRANPELQEVTLEMGALWADPGVRRVFVSRLTTSVDQLNQNSARVLKYKIRRGELSQLNQQHREMLTDHFQGRVKAPQLWKRKLAVNRTERIKKKNILRHYEVNGLMSFESETENGGKDKAHADLAAMVAFERIRFYRKQFVKEHFIMTPSRQKLLDQVVDIVARDSWVLLVGETGTGKSMLGKTTSHILNGEPPLYASGEKWGDVRTLVGVRSMDRKEAFYEFGPLTASLTGVFDSRQMTAEVDHPTDPTGKILQLDELNKFDQDALMGSLNLASTYRPGEVFTMSQLPGVIMRKARTGSGIIATMNPASVRYDRKELDPSIVRRFRDGTIIVDYLDMSPNNPELYEVFLAALMDDNGRIRIDASELAPAYTNVQDTDKKVVKQVLDTDPKKHGYLYRFALATHEVHKSFKHEANVGTTASNPKYLEKNVLDMDILMKWMKGYELEIDSGVPLETYMQGNLHRFYENIDTPEDQATFKAIMQQFGLSIEAPKPAIIQNYEPMTPLDIGYLSPQVPRPVKKNTEKKVSVTNTKIYINAQTGEQSEYLDQPATSSGKTYKHGDIIEHAGKKFRYIGINPTNPTRWVTDEIN